MAAGDRSGASLVVGLLLAVAIPPLQTTWAAERPDVYLPHPPIRIASDSDFLLPTSGVISGHGTPTDPYVITGWLILTTDVQDIAQAAIQITNTTASVVIKANEITAVNSAFAATGIRLENAKHVSIKENRLAALSTGIIARDASSLQIEDNFFDSLPTAISMIAGTNVLIDTNTISCSNQWLGYGGVAAIDIDEIIMKNNTIECKTGPGLSIWTSSRIEISDNLIENTTNPIKIYESSEANITGNQLMDSKGMGIEMLVVREFSLSNNYLHNASGGIEITFDPNADAGSYTMIGNRIDDVPRNPLIFRGPGYHPNLRMQSSDNWVDNLPIELFDDIQDVTLDGHGSQVAALVLIDGRNVTIQNWTIESYSESAMAILNGSSVSVARNIFGKGGLEVAWGRGNSVSNNEFRNASTFAAISIAAPETQVIGNRIVNGSRNGIVVTRYGESASGRILTSGAGSTLQRNSVNTVGWPLSIYYSSEVIAEHNTFGQRPVYVISSNDTILHWNSLLAGYVYAALGTWPGDSMSPLDARWNWWGREEGPYDPKIVPNGTIEVLESPWLTAPP